MSRAKAKELNNRKEGDRNACPLCNPNPKRVSMSRLWSWSLRNPGHKPFVSQGCEHVTQP